MMNECNVSARAAVLKYALLVTTKSLVSSLYSFVMQQNTVPALLTTPWSILHNT